MLKNRFYCAETLHLAGQGDVFGFDKVKLKPDMTLMQQRKKEIISEFAQYRTEQLEDGRFSLYRSHAKFLNDSIIELSDGKQLTSSHFMISTGSKIAMPPILGL